VAVGIIRQLNQQFIGKGVKFVVQVGDLVDGQSTNSIDTTAVFRQDLYNANIGFLPAARQPREQPGVGQRGRSCVPPDADGDDEQHPGQRVHGPQPGSRSRSRSRSSPGRRSRSGRSRPRRPRPAGFIGLEYAVDYNNARFVFLDQFVATTGGSKSVLSQADVDWMNGQLSGRPSNTHAFVFGHKGVITQNHTDTLFGNDPSSAPTVANSFVTDLANNGVRYYMGGHDHMYNRAIVSTTDHTDSVQDLVLASDSSKFYIPYGTAGYSARTVNPVTKPSPARAP